MKSKLGIKSQTTVDYGWKVASDSVSYDAEGVKEKLLNMDLPAYVVNENGAIGVSNVQSGQANDLSVIAHAQKLAPEELGDADYRADHGVKYAYYAGAMANGIASEELVIALGKQGILCSFGAAGLIPDRVEQAIRRIQGELPNGPYAFNLIHSPSEPALERGAVDRYLKLGVRTVEASAFLGLTSHIVYYRAAGLARGANSEIIINNKVIAKISRTETARKFMEPAPAKMLQKLVDEGLISADQMEMAQQVPMADDITA